VVDVEFLIGVDIGTLGSKGVIIDSEGRVLAQHFVEHGINIPRPGWAEQNPEDYWNDFVTIVKTLLLKSNVTPSRIAAVGVSGLVPDVIPIDPYGKPLRDCIIYMDRRAVEEAEIVREKIGAEKVCKISGNAIDPYFAGYKCLWLMRHESEIYEKTWKILDGSKYVVFKLTHETVLDYSTGPLFAPFFNLRDKRWDDEILNELGFDACKLPTICSPSDIVGEVTSSASEQTGIAKGTPVIAGGPDYQFSALSVGLVEPGDGMLMYGTTGLIAFVTGKPIYEPRLVNSNYVVPDTYMSFGGMATTGALVRWFRDEFGILERDVERLAGVSAYSLLDREAEKVPPGSDGLIVLPYFMGERTPIWDPRARGVIFGLTLYHTRAHIFRAILESAGYALRQHVEIVRELGIDIRRLIAVNGGAKSRLWRQIISDITGLPQQYVPEAPGAPYGDAFLAGVATGIFKNPTQIRDYVKIAEETRPNKENAAIYEKLYKIYLTLYPALKNQMHNL
jgi:xylulokinase